MTEKKTPDTRQRIEGNNRIHPLHKGKETMKPSIPEFPTNFDICTTHARVQIQSEADYWQSRSADYAAGINESGGLVRLTDDSESHILMSPAEALSIAAALQSVAVHLLEQQGRKAVAA